MQVSGGNRISQRMKDLSTRLTKNKGVYIGVPKAAGQYEDGTPLAVIGAVQEFGSADGRIPERSFLRVPLRSNRDKFAKTFRNQIPQVISGEITMLQLMEQLGASAESVPQEAISAGIAPPNAPSTIRRKGSSTPLVDKGRLRQAVTHVVEDGEQ